MFGMSSDQTNEVGHNKIKCSPLSKKKGSISPFLPYDICLPLLSTRKKKKRSNSLDNVQIFVLKMGYTLIYCVVGNKTRSKQTSLLLQFLKKKNLKH